LINTLPNVPNFVAMPYLKKVLVKNISNTHRHPSVA